MKHEADDCPHPDFEPGPVLLYIHGSMWRCLNCRTVWHASTAPVLRWMMGAVADPDGELF